MLPAAAATCAGGFSRGTLSPLVRCQELLAPTLLSLHNLHVVQAEFAALRAASSARAFP